jgi:nicotinate-nucleotide adenylyltransferase
MTRVALFGGSFNPPHVAHQLVALYVLETQPVDELWFLPVYEHVFGKQLASFEDRVTMCELSIAALGPRAKVSRVEEEWAQQPGFRGSRTFDVIEHLLATRPGLQPRLVIGTDILADTPKWHRWADVVAAAPLIVVGRPGHALPDGSSATGVTMPAISSTHIREAVHAAAAPRCDAELRSLLPASVLEYIDSRKLYR